MRTTMYHLKPFQTSASLAAAVRIFSQKGLSRSLSHRSLFSLIRVVTKSLLFEATSHLPDHSTLGPKYIRFYFPRSTRVALLDTRLDLLEGYAEIRMGSNPIYLGEADASPAREVACLGDGDERRFTKSQHCAMKCLL